MEKLIEDFVAAEKLKFPSGISKEFSYGTAGFRDRADLLECVLFRSAIVASLRSKCVKAAIGIVITASHNPEQDNGVKFIDTQGQMLIPEWEEVASLIANAKTENLYDNVISVITKYNLDYDFKPVVLIARDTRPSSDALSALLIEGLNILHSEYIDNGYLTTPQLHYIVKSYNSGGQYGQPTLRGYYEKLSKAFKELMPQSEVKPVMKLDAANGVGAGRAKDLLEYIRDLMSIEVYNDGTTGKLNYMCGADYVKTQQVAPNGVPIVVEDCYVSFDGDADRIVFFYIDKNGEFALLDGDKIACLIAMFIQDLLERLQLKLDISVIQTAYANGNSTKYIQDALNINATCVKTGVKYLQRKANEFDIGIFFEANGHGTVLYSNNAVNLIEQSINNEKLTPDARECARDLLNFIDLTNQTTGDAISDLLIVQVILSRKQWTCTDWGQIYTDLPNKQLKVKVKRRDVITTTDDEAQCITPSGLQDAINMLVSTVPSGRSFVRPSGTEDVVRVYAEAKTKELAEKLALDVAQKVYDLAGGIGDRPSF